MSEAVELFHFSFGLKSLNSSIEEKNYILSVELVSYEIT